MMSVFRGIVPLLLTLCLLTGCTGVTPVTRPTGPVETTVPTAPTEPATQPPTEPPTQPPTEPPTQPLHSELYLPTVSVEDMIRYFKEVCLDAEIVNGGDPTKLQKWTTPILFHCEGPATAEDRKVLDSFVAWLNEIEGFPGMRETESAAAANLRIRFCGPAEYLDYMGSGFSGTDGGITFWYNGANEIYDAMIGCRTDIDQKVRNSVILEEIYNGLGPIQDTALRNTSVIYAGYSTPQWLSEVDQVILKLLYSSQMRCGMDAAACEAVIRQLYY